MRTLLWIIRRLWDTFVGLLMIALSLLLQLLLFMLFSMSVVPMLAKWCGASDRVCDLAELIAFYSLFVLFNGVSCFEYFRRRKVATLYDSQGRLQTAHVGDVAQVSMAIFLVPRGLQRIFAGSECQR
ncbi:MAG: hypothetical protein K8T25_19945 [Planctomycetia bacterium]|nr:hypothetical protein [Planctomycetia bacterium]